MGQLTKFLIWSNLHLFSPHLKQDGGNKMLECHKAEIWLAEWWLGKFQKAEYKLAALAH